MNEEMNELLPMEDKPKATKKSPKKKNTYGQYGNVQLTDEELQKLKDEFPDWQDKIQHLDDYIATHSTKYKNHYLVIKTWERNSVKRNSPQQFSPITPTPATNQQEQQEQAVDPYLMAMWNLFTAFGKGIETDRQRLYADKLRRYNPQIVDKAAEHMMMTESFLPPLAMLVTKCNELAEKAQRIAWTRSFGGAFNGRL